MVLPDTFVSDVRATAESAFIVDDFYCSEAVIKAVLQHTGRLDAYSQLIALGSALPKGMGSGCSCGAVTGAALSLGIFFGRTDPTDPSVERCISLGHELHDAFRSIHKSICCRVLNKKVLQGSPEQLELCRIRVGDAAEIVARILQREWETKTSIFGLPQK